MQFVVRSVWLVLYCSYILLLTIFQIENYFPWNAEEVLCKTVKQNFTCWIISLRINFVWIIFVPHVLNALAFYTVLSTGWKKNLILYLDCSVDPVDQNCSLNDFEEQTKSQLNNQNPHAQIEEKADEYFQFNSQFFVCFYRNFSFISFNSALTMLSG